MRDINWRAAGPILLLGVGIGWLVVWNSGRSSNPLLPWLVLGPPILSVGFGLMAMAAWLRRRKSSRTWDLMQNGDPHAIYFIIFVYPTVKSQLNKLGWRLQGPAYLSIPAIGVSISPYAITFWETGVAEPTLALAAPDVNSAAVGRVSDGYRGHPALRLTLKTANRNNELQLNLRDSRHRNISPAEMNEAVERIRDWIDVGGHSNVTIGP